MNLRYRQSVLIALLVKLNALPHSWKEYDVDDVSLGLQNFLICAEMLVAAVVHYFVFSHKPFIDPAASQVCRLSPSFHLSLYNPTLVHQVPCYSVCLRMLDVRDVCGDVKTHFVDPIPKPSLSSESTLYILLMKGVFLVCIHTTDGVCVYITGV